MIASLLLLKIKIYTFQLNFSVSYRSMSDDAIFYVQQMSLMLESAQSKISAIPNNATSFLILNAMLNFANGNNYIPFLQTQEIIAHQILSSNDLQALSEQYDNTFLMPMRSMTGGFPELANKRNLFESKVRER